MRASSFWLCLWLAFPLSLFSLSPQETLQEKRANLVWEQGHFEKALSLYWQLFQKEELSTEEKAYFLARCFLLAKEHIDLRWSLEQKLEQWEKTLPKRPAFLKLYSRWIHLWLAAQRGDLSKIQKLRTQVGLLQNWALLGPFDNDRGGGFDTAYPPEKAFQPYATVQGKKHSLSWRFHSCRAPTGKVELDVLMQPNEQALAYATTFVYLPTSQKVILALSTQEGFKIWIDNQLLDAQKLHRQLAPLQNLYLLHMEKGWHKIQLKVLQSDGLWSFRLAITTSRGEPVKGLRSARSLAEMAQIKKLSQWKRLPNSLLRLGKLEKSQHPRHWHYAALLYYALQKLDRDDPKLANLWKRAAQKAKSSHYALWSSYSLAQSHKKVEEQDLNEYRRALEMAVRWNPKSALAYARLGKYYLKNLRNSQKALSFLNKALAIHPFLLDALWSKVQIYHSWEWPESALLERWIYQKLIHKLSVRESYIHHLWRTHRYFQAQRMSETILQEAPATFPYLTYRLADFYLRQGKVEKCLALLKRYLTFRPYDTPFYRLIQRVYKGREEWAKAEEWLDRQIGLQPHKANLWQEKAMLALAQKRPDLALRWLKRARQLAPTNLQIRRSLKLLEGEGEALERQFREPVAVLVRKAQKRAYAKDMAAHVLLNKKVVQVYPDGTFSEFHQRLLRISNEGGIKQFAQYSIPYYWGEQVVEVLVAQIHRNGKILKGSPLGSYRGAEVILFPPLQVGDIVEVQYRLDLVRPTYFGSYFGTTFYFQEEFPVDRAIFCVVAPPQRKLYFHTYKVSTPPKSWTLPSGLKAHQWEMKNLPPIRRESQMPDLREISPYVQVSTYRNWQEFGKWYWNLIHRQMEASEELKRKVRELTKDKKTAAEKVRAIYDYVVSKIRYSSEWEFGIHGYKPYSAAAIYNRKFGDCKDKAILITTMLKELGIRSYPVLIRGEDWRSREDLRLPLVSHFNHCISFVPQQKGIPQPMFLDGTAQYHSVDALPAMDWGAQVVVVTPKGGQVHSIVYPRPEENSYRATYKVRLALDGSAEITLHFEGRKWYAVFFRQTFQNRGQRKKVWSRLLSRSFGSVEVLEVAFSPLEKLESTVRGKVRFRVSSFWEKRQQKWWLPLIADPLWIVRFGRSLTSWVSTSERTHDLLLPPPTKFDLVMEVELPKSFQPAEPAKEQHLQSPYGKYQLQWYWKRGRLYIRRSFQLFHPRVKAQDYASFREFLRNVEKWEKWEIPLERPSLK